VKFDGDYSLLDVLRPNVARNSFHAFYRTTIHETVLVYSTRTAF